MKVALAIAAGAAVGLALGLRLRPHSESTCARRVAQGFRAELGAKCGPLGFLCRGAADALGATDPRAANSILDLFGL